AAGTEDGAVYLWDAASGRRRDVLRGYRSRFNPLWISSRIACLAFSPDGSRLACSTLHPTTAREVRLWDVGSGRMLLRLEQNAPVGWLQFSPDGHRLLVGAEGRSGELRVWDGTPWEPKAAPRQRTSRN